MARRDLKRLAANIYRNHGDALAGECILAVARDVSKPRVVPGTATHKIQEIVLRSNVLCVIDRPFKLAGGPMKIA